MDKDWLKVLLKKSQNETKIVEILSIDCKEAVKKGENYGSEIIRICADVLLGSGLRCRKRFILKTEVKVEDMRVLLRKSKLFQKEIRVYSEILFEMENLMNEFQDTNESLWAHCFGHESPSYIFLEDLTEKGYKNANRIAGFDEHHLELALISLARFHAMSVVLINRGIIDIDTYLDYILCKKNLIQEFCDGNLSMLAKVMQNEWGDEWKTEADFVDKELKANCIDKLNDLCQEENIALRVYNHGDFWINNIMFRYNINSQIPVGIKFIDFPLGHFNSFAWDLTYFIHLCLKPEEIAEKYDKILTTYRNALLGTLNFYGGEYSKLVPTFDEMKKEMTRLHYYGFIVAALVLPIIICEEKDLVDNLLEKSDKSYGMYSNPVYSEHMKFYFKHYASVLNIK